MRCLDTTSSCSADVRVFADKVECGEYQVSGEDKNVQCWIPVVSGQELTIQCDLTMTSLLYHVDLIIDGVLRNVWVSTIGQKTKPRDSQFEFEEGIFKSVRSLHRSPMRTARLGQVAFSPTNDTTVGTIEIHISMVDENFTYKHDATLPDDIDTWKDLPVVPGTMGVDPTHHIKLAGDERVLESLRKTLRNKWSRPRPGKAAWAVFKFFYRDAAALRSVGIMDPVNTVPILLPGGSTASPAIKVANDEDSYFAGSSRVDENGHRRTSSVLNTPERQFVTPENDFTTMDDDGNTDSSQRGPGLPRRTPNMSMSDPTLGESSTRGESGSKRKRAAAGAANGAPGNSAATTKAMKRRKKDIDSLKEELARLEGLRDEARLKHEAEQRRTEDAARKLEEEWAELSNTKEHLERAIDDENYGAYAQLQEQRRLKSSMRH